MQRVTPQKLSDVILQQLESMLLQGQFLPGQKLPSERELAERFAVSRPSLREAMQKLEAKGLVYRKQGGGTYIKDKLSPSMTDPLLDLIANQPESQFDLLEFRHALEGMAAYYAALRAEKTHRDKVKSAFAQVESSRGDIGQEALALTEFYLAVSEAAQNVVLLQVVRSLKTLLEENIRRNLDVLRQSQSAVSQINMQRRKIVDAILNADPGLARQASNEHLAFIEDTLLNINRQDTRMQRALRRI